MSLLGKVLRASEERKRAVRHSPAFSAAARSLAQIEKEHGLTLLDCLDLRQALLDTTLDRIRELTSAAGLLPSKAPELWSHREGRKENPIEFIRRVYAHWLDRGLTRAHLRLVDPPLYQALAVWMHRHPDAVFPGLDLQSDQINHQVERLLRDPVSPRKLRRTSASRSRA